MNALRRKERDLVRRIYNHLPRGSVAAPSSRGRQLMRLARHVALGTGYFALAWLRGGPGLPLHARLVRLGMRLRSSGTTELPPEVAWNLMLAPLDSFRYFEFEFAWSAALRLQRGTYLDVSSPRMFPILLLIDRPELRAHVVNPDRRDLVATEALANALGLASRFSAAPSKVDELTASAGSYDFITSLSVLEHIPSPGDAAAMARLWELVAPGGRLVVTVPCARDDLEEFIDMDEYGLLEPDRHGYVFGQRLYSQAALEQTFFSIAGAPARFAVYGERRPGRFFVDRATKVAGFSAHWREPYMMATEFCRFRSASDLPGWGVAAMEFVKP